MHVPFCPHYNFFPGDSLIHSQYGPLSFRSTTVIIVQLRSFQSLLPVPPVPACSLLWFVRLVYECKVGCRIHQACGGTVHLIPDTPDTGSVSLFFPGTSRFQGKRCPPVWKSLIKTVFLRKCRRLSGRKIALYCASGRGSGRVVVSTDQGGDRSLEGECGVEGNSVNWGYFKSLS